MSIPRCPLCNSFALSVVDSRPLRRDNLCRRRYRCASCAHRFSTVEGVVPDSMRGRSVGKSVREFHDLVEKANRIADIIRRK